MKGEINMARKILSMNRYEEIKRLLDLKVPIRQIERSLHCCRKTIRFIRDGKIKDPNIIKVLSYPVWSEQLNWDEILEAVKDGHPLSLIWEDKVSHITSYVNFWRQFYKRHPEFKEALVTLREFEPGERAEVDYAGGKITWFDPRTKALRKACVFIGALGFSQLVFATAKEDQASPNWLSSHVQMFEAFRGVPGCIVPDCLKQGVSKCHLYDPDLNPSYFELAKYYQTAILPARPGHPKDKALAELSVKLVMRYFKWKYRKHTFTSLYQINEKLKEVCDYINRKKHSRFKISRLERFEQIEKPKLKPLPITPYEIKIHRDAKVHPDCHLGVDGNYYSAPHIYRARTLRVVISEKLVELFINHERVALHVRAASYRGIRITEFGHLPENSRAYREATPQNLLSQARFIHKDLYTFLDKLFEQDTLIHLRRAQGLIREARKEIEALGHEAAKGNISLSIAQMLRFDKIRVPYFRELLNHYRKQNFIQPNLTIQRGPNPMLRHTPLHEQKCKPNPN